MLAELERAVMDRRALGWTMKETANGLGIPFHAAKKAQARAMRKLGARNCLQAVARLQRARAGMPEPEYMI